MASGLVMASVGGVGVARAQATAPAEAAIDPEQLVVPVDPEAIGLIDGARTQTPGSVGIAAALQVIGPVLPVCVRGGMIVDAPPCDLDGNVLRTRLRGEVGALYGLGRVDVRVHVPVVLYETADVGGPARGGVGDPRVAARVQLARPGPVAIAADVAATVPLGGDDFIGDRGVVAEPRLLVDVRRGALAAGAALGYRYRRDAVRLADLYVDDELTFALAGEYAIAPRTLTAAVGVLGRVGLVDAPADGTHAARPAGADERPVEALASMRLFFTPHVALDLAGGTALTSGYGAAPFRVLAGLRWIDRKPDPRAAARARTADRDHDGLRDLDDRCPDDAEDRDGFVDDDGCPEADNDHDGVLDGADRCPLAPEDIDGVDDGDGCPDTDDDHDGVDDAYDACPGDAEDRDALVDDDGCPETDADGDGVRDELDRCPLDAELLADADGDGCADRPRAPVVVEGDNLIPADRFFFAFNRADLEPASAPAIAAIVAYLQAHPDVRLRVEGHADDRGQEAWNLELSQRRADAVRAALIAGGIAGDRLDAKGFGTARPLVPGTSDAARARNRRVELVLVGRP